MIAVYITHLDLDLYLGHGWRVTYYGERGDDRTCFVASFVCDRNPHNSRQREKLLPIFKDGL